MRISCLGILLFFIPLLAGAQEVINGHDFLRRALQDGTDAPTTDGKHREIKFPWIEQYEFRTETRDFEFDEQEYLFRLSPSTSAKRRAQQALYEQYAERPNYDLIDDLCDAAYQIHVDWLALSHAQSLTIWLDSLQLILDDKITLFERRAGTLDVDVDKYIDLTREHTQLAEDKLILQGQDNLLRRRYGYENSQLSLTPVLSIVEMKNMLASIEIRMDPAAEEERRYEKQLNDKEMALELAESRQYIDFAQLRYQGPHSDFFRERVSVSFAFRLPTSGNRKLNMEEIRIKEDRQAQAYQRDIQRKTEEVLQDIDQLLIDIEIYERTEELIAQERQQMLAISTQIAKSSVYKPEDILQTQERHIKNMIRLTDSKNDLMRDFLRILDDAGILCTELELNHLLSKE